MKRIAYFLTIFCMLLFACSLANTPTQIPTSLPTATSAPATASLPPIATQPPTATEPLATTQPAAAQVNVTCNELRLYLDSSLATGYNCETIPAQTDGMELNPQYTQLTLNGYPLTDKFFTPHISVYSVQAFTALLPDQVASNVGNLQSLTGGAAPGDASLPFLPFFNAAQVFHAQYLALPFQSGTGIRYMVIFAQYFAPVNNHDLFYTYQGLSRDGQYWVSAILPINHPSLPENADNPPNGQSWDQFNNDYPAYTADMTSQLNSADPASFTPSLASLDALVASILIQP